MISIQTLREPPQPLSGVQLAVLRDLLHEARDNIPVEPWRTHACLDEIAALLGTTLPGNPADQTVLIRADKDVRYKEFMAVVNQLQKDGYYKIGLISEDLG